MKKILSLILALALVLSLAVVASAASITITPPEGAGTDTGITYNAYKIFDATIIYKTDVDGEFVLNENNEKIIEKIAYTIDSKNNVYYETINAATNYFKLDQVGTTDIYNVTVLNGYNDAAADTFAETLKAVTATAVGEFVEVKDEDGKTTGYKNEGLADGYYLVTSSVGSDLILDTIGDITVGSKNEYPSLEKKIDEGTEKKDSTTADMGEVLTFTIDVTIPKDAVGEIVVHDKMTGLAYQSMTVVEGIDDEVPTVDAPFEDECAVHFTLNDTYVSTNKGKTVTITYTAKVTADVANNEAWLVDDTFTSTPDSTTVYSTDIVINKVVKDTTTPLSGAKFVLKNGKDDNSKFYAVDDDGNVSWVESQDQAEVVITGEDGKAKFENIADGTYYLVETEAPTGYNLLTDAQEVTVSHTGKDDNGADIVVQEIPAKVENSTGSELPSTGGMGTTIFYIFGSLMTVGAVVLLVTKKRMA